MRWRSGASVDSSDYGFSMSNFQPFEARNKLTCRFFLFLKRSIECDEMWSFVFSKTYKFYIWLAIDRDTREIIGCYVGDRSRQSARKLWASLPGVYRQCAVAYTDFWQAYRKVIPSKRHRAVGKDTGQTNHIERLNNTFRQRVSRLVRKSLSFSKKLDNHVGAIWYFIHDYNAQLAKH